ncbi:hypothetical protein TWF694_011457 [Orbilia ellipsospora]|uniref:Uncharacterized protein n=1 Tax=Orbilia ellipsospora TaxID=2528407 RepID=A0AAV9X5D0_9PEZI
MVQMLSFIPTILCLITTLPSPSHARFEIGFRRYLFSESAYPPLDTYQSPYACNSINQPINPTNFIKWIVLRFTTSRGYGSNPFVDSAPQAIAFYRSQAPTNYGPHCLFHNAEAIAHYYPTSNTMQWFKTRRASLTHFRVLDENSREWKLMLDERLQEGGVIYRSYNSGWNKSPTAISIQDDEENFGFDGSSSDDSWRDENDSEDSFPEEPDTSFVEEDDEVGYENYSADSANADTEVNTEAPGWGFMDMVAPGLREVDPWDRFTMISEILEANEDGDHDDYGEILSSKIPVEDEPPLVQYNTEIKDVDRNLIRLRNQLIDNGQYVPVPSIYREKSLGELRWMGFKIYPKEEVEEVRLEWVAQAFYGWKKLNGLNGDTRWVQLTPAQRESLAAFLGVQPKWQAESYIVDLVREHNIGATRAAQNQVTDWGHGNAWSSDFLVKQEDEDEFTVGQGHGGAWNESQNNGDIQPKMEEEDFPENDNFQVKHEEDDFQDQKNIRVKYEEEEFQGKYDVQVKYEEDEGY